MEDIVSCRSVTKQYKWGRGQLVYDEVTSAA